MNFKVVAVGLAGAAVGVLASPPAVQAATNYFDVTKTVTSMIGWASCPSGWKLTGGGVAQLPSDYFGSTTSDEYKLTGSYPSSNSWKASAIKTHGSYSSTSGWKFTSSSYSPTVYAICVS